ncbi:MAG: hypothetical protein KDC53_16110, partial [Saprospiraceae bacterium]|nr:hypothetical protein [Saprospiraceae bacterium]
MMNSKENILRIILLLSVFLASNVYSIGQSYFSGKDLVKICIDLESDTEDQSEEIGDLEKDDTFYPTVHFLEYYFVKNITKHYYQEEVPISSLQISTPPPEI